MKFDKIIKLNYILNMKKKARTNLIILIVITLIAAFNLVLVKNISDSEKKHEAELEQTVITASEQYINFFVENVVAIGKSIYTNSNIYDFLNKDYASALEYYDAFYELESNNYLIISENSSIKKCTVYTDNPTVLNGGNIMNLSGLKDEKWYVQFQKLSKPMILFCNKDTKTFSIIRKLDYYNLRTGECYLKLDLNNDTIQETLSKFDFEGELYIMSDGVLFYSNQSDVNDDDVNISQNYICYTQNYYSADMEFFAYSDNNSFLNSVRENFIIEIIFLIILISDIIILSFIMKSYIIRIKKSVEFYDENRSFVGLPKEYIGDDDLGQLYMHCISLSDKLTLKQHEYERCRDILIKRSSSINELLISALSLDSVNSFIMKYPSDKYSYGDFTKCIPLEKEFEILYSLEKYGMKISADKNIDCENLFILPFSLASMAAYFMNYDKNTELNIEFCDGFLIFDIKTDNKLPQSKVLKFHAVFENNFHQDISFKSGYEFNPFIRLKKYYASGVSEIISEENGFRFTIKINTDSLMR